MKVFLAGTSFNPEYGGPAVSVSRLAIALAAKGVEVLLWAPDGSAKSSPLIKQCEGVTTACGPLRQVLENAGRSIDLIHDNGIWLPHNHALAQLASRSAIPRVVSLRGMLEPRARSTKRAKKSLAWWLYQHRDLSCATILHATASSEAEAVSRLRLPVPTVIVPNGVDLPVERMAIDPKSNIEHRTALYLGRIDPIKGIPTLLKAWSFRRPKGWELLIVGPGEKSYLEQLRRQAQRLGLEQEVTFSEAVYGAEKTYIYHSADLFILPTYSENFGMSVAEALAHELPVLTTTGAPWELLIKDGCGWWVPPTEEGLSHGLALATQTSDTRLREMGRKGRFVAREQFAWGSIAQAMLEKIYLPALS